MGQCYITRRGAKTKINQDGTILLNIPFTSDLSYTGDVDLNITVEGNDLTFTNDGILSDETRIVIQPVDFLKNFSKFTFEFDVKFRQVNKSARRIVLLGGAIGYSNYSPLLRLDSNKFTFVGVESANTYGAIATSNNYNDNDFHHISLTYYMDTNFVFLTVDGSDCAAARFNNIGCSYIVLGHTYEPLYGYIKNFIIKAEG